MELSTLRRRVSGPSPQSPRAADSPFPNSRSKPPPETSNTHHQPSAFGPNTQTLSYYFFPAACFGSNMLVESASGESLYYCDCSERTTAPDIVLHEGAEKSKGPVVGGAEFRKGTVSRMLLGSGARERDNYARDVEYEGERKVAEMKLEKNLAHGRYSLAVPEPGTGDAGGLGTGTEGARLIEWHRTRKRDHGCEGIARWSANNFAITDGKTQQLLGVTVRSPKFSLRRKGKLVVRADVPDDVRLCLLLGALGLTEMARRRDARWQPQK